METGYRVPYLLQMIALHISTAKDQNSSGTVDMAEAFTHQCDQMSWGAKRDWPVTFHPGVSVGDVQECTHLIHRQYSNLSQYATRNHDILMVQLRVLPFCEYQRSPGDIAFSTVATIASRSLLVVFVRTNERGSIVMSMWT